MTGEKEPDKIWAVLHQLYPRLSAVITLGSSGSAAYRVSDGMVESAVQPAVKVRAVDTTAAGDAYTGYFLAGLAEGLSLRDCMGRASTAAAISVTRPGAAESIPTAEETEQFNRQRE